MDFQFFMPAQVLGGYAAVEHNAEIFSRLGKTCMLVTSGTAAHKSGALQDVTDALTAQGVTHVHFSEVKPNPTAESCHRAGQLARDYGVEYIVGIGGGSALDAAKAIAVYAANKTLTAEGIYDGGYMFEPLPTVLIGTTAGTGSEVTGVSVLTRENGRKQSVSGRDFYARYALADPKYTYSVPYPVTVSTALDAFAHAAEGWFSNRFDDMARLFGEKAIPVLWKYLKAFYDSAESPRPEGTARKRLFRNPDDRMLGGVLSGVACYFGGDPLLWRLAMVAFFLLSGGTALLVYVVLWIVVPLARTPEEQLLMRGRPVTAGSLGEAVTAQARRAGQGGTRTEPAVPQGGTYGFFNRLLRVLTFVLKAFLYACAVCLLLGMLLLLCATVLPLFFGLVFSPLHWVEHWGDGEWLYTVSLSPAVGWTFVGALLVVLFVPAYCLLHKARRLGGRAPGMGYAQRVVWVVLWLLALVVLCYLTVGWVLPYFW